MVEPWFVLNHNSVLADRRRVLLRMWVRLLLCLGKGLFLSALFSKLSLSLSCFFLLFPGILFPLFFRKFFLLFTSSFFLLPAGILFLLFKSKLFLLFAGAFLLLF